MTERSVEEQVMAGASRKIEMDKKVIQAGRYDNKSTAEERDEFLVSTHQVLQSRVALADACSVACLA